MRMKPLIALLMMTLAGAAGAATIDAIPENEVEFVNAIQSSTKGEIAELLGEPAYSHDIRNVDGDLIGAIWHYHFITTGEDGNYYKTTELDFVGDRVVTVVLANDDESGVTEAPCDQDSSSC
jgi:hypothetical protein